MLESVFFSFVSLVVALIIASVAISHLDQIFNNNLSFSIGDNLGLMSGFILLSLLVGLLSGLYPTVFTLSNKLSVVNKPEVPKAGKISFRNGLVVFQFFVSIVLTMSFLTVNKQLNFVRTKDLGFDKENVITFSGSSDLFRKLDVFREELAQNPNIISVSGSKRVPSQRLDDSNGAKIISNGNMEPLGFRMSKVLVDEYFIPTYKIKLIAGNNITNQKNEAAEYMINRSSVEKIGWKSPEEALGQFIEYGGRKGKVVGVIENFHYESLHSAVFPIILYSHPSDFNRISIRVSPANLSNTIVFIEKIWEKYNTSGAEFSYQFIDQSLGKLYQSEEYIRTIFSYFMGLAIFIAIMGLFGLSLFILDRQTKEIGIRRVNGAKISEVLAMLNRDFVKWVAIAFVIATPIAYYAMNKWLQNFAYRTELSWWIFAIAGLFAMFIALVTVSWQSWRAATRNPVEALRSE